MVLVRPSQPEFYFLNPTAQFIWDRWRTGSPLPDIASSLSSAFAVPYRTAERDVRATVNHWSETLLLSPPCYAPSQSAPVPCIHDRVAATDYVLNGRRFRLYLHSDDLVREIAPRVESLRAASSPPAFTFHLVSHEEQVYVFSGETCLAVEENAAAGRSILLQEMVRLAKPGRDWLALLHSGACGNESHCVIFPAASHSGKTTLAAVLMNSGLTLYSDDSVGLERESLTIPAMPFALAIREGSWLALSSRIPEIEHLPVHNRYGQNIKFLHPVSPVQNANARAAAIVFSRWQPRATTTISALSNLEALVRLKESGFWVAHDRDSIQTFLGWIQSLPVYEMVYSDLDEASTFIKGLLDS